VSASADLQKCELLDRQEINCMFWGVEAISKTKWYHDLL